MSFGAHLCLLLLLTAIAISAGSSSCRWRFESCHLLNNVTCEVVLRQWCGCSGGLCPGNTTRTTDIASLASPELEQEVRRSCQRTTCTIATVPCPWQAWSPTRDGACGSFLQRRKRFRCCHPIARRPLPSACDSLDWDIRSRTQSCHRNETVDNSGGSRRPTEISQDMKVAFVLIGFLAFLVVAAIVGRAVGRPICQRRAGLGQRRHSLPIVLQLPERRKAPTAAIIPQPGQPLPPAYQPIAVAPTSERT